VIDLPAAVLMNFNYKIVAEMTFLTVSLTFQISIIYPRERIKTEVKITHEEVVIKEKLNEAKKESEPLQ
jgi:hypothetical protein